MIRPRVVFLTCHLPFPPLSGGRRRELELIRRLSQRFDFHLMVASKTLDEDLQNVRHLEPYCSRIEVFAVEPLPPNAERSPEAVQVLRHRCPELSQRMGEALEDAELVHVEGFYLADHVPERHRVPMLLVEQNVEYELWRQRAHARHRGAQRLDPAWQHRVTRRAETETWRRADLVATLTVEDRATIRSVLPNAAVQLVPDGSDHLARPGAAYTTVVGRPASPLLVFVANFAYEPNVDAAVHLCEDILPLLQARVPAVRVWLVGNAPPPAVQRLAGERVSVTGRVPDVVPYIDAADVIACPLRIGGGMKVKVLEALQRGRALVSSSVGVQGFPPEASELLVVEDHPASFAAAAAELLVDAPARARAEQHATSALSLLPTWDEAADALADVYDGLIDFKRGVAPQELAV